MGLLSTITTPIVSSRWYQAMFSRSATATRASVAASRVTSYEINEALYDNTIYDAYLTNVLSTNFSDLDPAKLKFMIRGFCNPIKEIVDVYQNCLPGTWGDGVEIDPMIDGKPVNPKLIPAIRRVWRDSNFDTAKEVIQRYAANLGTVGLRPTRVKDKVVIQVDHPSRIFHLEKDGEGNITAVVLKYQIQRFAGPRTDPDYWMADVVQEITKDDFSYKLEGKEQLADGDRKNRFGFCPYVTLLHKDNGTDFGDWAYRGSESVIHAINFRITQCDRAVARLMFPKWFLGAPGDKPQTIDIGGEKASYVKLSPDSPAPFLEAIVPKIDINGVVGLFLELISQLSHRHPELALNALKLLANTSAEAMEQALKQVEAAIKLVRPAYDHAFQRVAQMATSMGIDDVLPGFDVGAATGDSAYQQGLLAFQFAPRPALPLTPAQQTAIATANVADRGARFTLAAQAQKLGVSDDEVLRIAGYTEEQIREIRTERAQVDVVPTQEL